MRETFIITDLNGTQLLRMLAENGRNTFGVRVLKLLEFAKETLLRNGVPLVKEELNPIRQECIISEILKSVEYFGDVTLSDGQNVAKAIRNARMLCRGNEEEKLHSVFSQGEFIDKNTALLEVIDKYLEYRRENGLCDDIDIMNLALKKGKEIDADFFVLKETSFRPLEDELVRRLCRDVKTISVFELAGKKERKPENSEYFRGYGTINEIEHIFSFIGEHQIPYDHCLITTIDPSCIQSIEELSALHNIPVTYGNGLPLSETHPARVLCLLKKWEEAYHSIDPLMELFDADEFDGEKLLGEGLSFVERNQIIKILGALRISTDEKENRKKLENYRSTLTDEKEQKIFENVLKAANEFSKGYSHLIKVYSKIREGVCGTKDRKAVAAICSLIDTYEEYGQDIGITEICDELLKKNIGKEMPKGGYIHVSDLHGSLSCLREHVFICGLGAGSFPGSPTEDYLLLDSDLKLFDEELAVTSDKKIRQNREGLLSLVRNAASMSCALHLSYSVYNLSEMKEENPSSMLFELFRMEKGENVSIKDMEEALGNQYSYFDGDLSSLKNIGQGYKNEKLIESGEGGSSNAGEIKPEGVLSPSSAEVFFECPKRYYLRYVLKVKEIEENDPFNPLPASDEGTLIHECMEDYGYHPSWTKEEFMENARNKFDEYFLRHIPLHDKTLKERKRVFLEMASTGYESDPHNKVLWSEKYLGPLKHEATGLTFGGIVDRVEEMEDGSLRIVDFKTYKDIRNIEDDIASCLQVVIYAWILETTENRKVDCCEYRYLRNERQIFCSYSDLMKNRMDEHLMKIREAFDSGSFPCTNDEKACRYCSYAKICGKEENEMTKEEEE